jgi:hypothetical protein
MSVNEWLTCVDPEKMLDFLERRESRRKLLLFGVAGCRRALPLSTDARRHQVVEAAERAADGCLSAAVFEEALQPVIQLWGELAAYAEGAWVP